MLHRRIAWSLTVLLFIVLLVWWFFLDPGWEVRYANYAKRVFVLAFTFMSMTLVAPIVVALLLALIPRPKVAYIRRVGGRLPWCLSVWFGLMALTYAWPRMHDWKEDGICTLIAAGLHDVVRPDGVDCSTVHEGRFRTGPYTIIRSKDRQDEFSPDGKHSSFSLLWTGECSYELLKEDEGSKQLRVNILAVREDGYDCVIGDSANCAIVRLTRSP